MVSEIRIFVEGDKALLKGLRAFLKPAMDTARRRRIKFNMVASGSANETVKDFMREVRRNPASLNILLLDSDRPDNGRLIASLKNSPIWNSQTGATIRDDQIHFMVQVMESWFLADKDAIARYYGQGFQANRLPPNPNVEQVMANDAIRRIEDATRRTQKGTYHKTRHAPDLLAQIDPNKVRDAAPNCRRLFTTLQNLT